MTAVAINKAREFNLQAVGCASTGNLANSVAANAAAAGLPAFVLIPESIEPAKVIATSVYGARVFAVRGNCDDVNRLSAEIAEQLGWRAPDCVVAPMAGGSLMSKIGKALAELARIGLIDESLTRLYGAQAWGCNPIADAVKRRSADVLPVKPDTIARSLAIGDPADGYHAAPHSRKPRLSRRRYLGRKP